MTPAERIAQLESAMAEMAVKMDAVMSDNERLASLVSSSQTSRPSRPSATPPSPSATTPLRRSPPRARAS